MSLSIAWLIAFVVLLFIELITVNLVTIWFAIGAIIALISSFFIDSFMYQMIIFVITSIIALIVTRPLMKKFKGFSIVPTNSDRVIGKIGEVTKKIEKNKYGEVKIFGNTWTAYSNSEIDVGCRVKVLEIEGVKLIVEKEED